MYKLVVFICGECFFDLILFANALYTSLLKTIKCCDLYNAESNKRIKNLDVKCVYKTNRTQLDIECVGAIESLTAQ